MSNYIQPIRFILCLNRCTLTCSWYNTYHDYVNVAACLLFLVNAGWTMVIWRNKSKVRFRKDYKLLLNRVTIHEMPAAMHLLTSGGTEYSITRKRLITAYTMVCLGDRYNSFLTYGLLYMLPKNHTYIYVCWTVSLLLSGDDKKEKDN